MELVIARFLRRMASNAWAAASIRSETRRIGREDAILRAQRSALDDEARDLKRLVRIAQSADGRMQALQAGNQFASQQIGQMQKLRSVLLGMQEILTLEQLTGNALETEQRAAHQRMLEQADEINTGDGGSAW